MRPNYRKNTRRRRLIQAYRVEKYERDCIYS